MKRPAMSHTRFAGFLLTVSSALIASSLLYAQGPRTAPRFYDDDPVARVADTQDASKVQSRDISLYYDALTNLFGRPGERTVGRARSVNTIDEVPDSSWYSNRVGLTPEQVMRGPSEEDTGPAQGKLTVSRKANGVSPGFTVTDTRGHRYFVKFDPPKWPELGTSAEVVVSRLYHALGYYTAQTNLGSLRREDLVIAPDATVRIQGNKRRRMRESDIDEQLGRAHRNPDGSYRAVFSLALPGTPLEGFKYEGTRTDDPNDVIPHEDRRELRALRVFGAWVNHTDAKAINSLDTLVTENGRAFVRHHVIDFNAALGSAGIALRERRDGYEYLAEGGPSWKALPSFGLYVRPWMTIDYPSYPGIGRFESARFEPENWRPRVPNPAYVRSRADDTFWGARKLMGLSDDMIRAAVKAGRYSDPRSEQFLVDALTDRRNKIARVWLTGVNPIVNPALGANGTLTFGNAAVEQAGAAAPSEYKAVWNRFDNATGAAERLAETSGSSARLQAPAALPSAEGTFIRIDLSASGGAHPSWASPVHGYFRRVGAGWKLVGFDRMPNAGPMRPGLVGAEPLARP
ncbi:MAG: hypothetical protein LC804_02980 [Acidobacteria bacterium]|nr:hypothetical protein [Acidobacteriota bacterium]